MAATANKLYTINTGEWLHDYSLLVRYTKIGEEYLTPLPCYLIEHPEGLVLVEAGISPELSEDPADYGPWGSPWDVLDRLEISEEHNLIDNLSSIGYSPQDIDHVILSHLHCDHCGYVSELPHSEYLIQEKELRYAFWPTDEFQRQAYLLGDFGMLRSAEYNVTPLSGKYDVFGDGSIECLPMPGHTPGHQIVKVELEEAGTILLGAGLAHTQEGFDKELNPPFNWSTEESIKSIRKTREIAKKEDARIVLQHEREHLEELPEFPNALV